jgi:hypothetical protein
MYIISRQSKKLIEYSFFSSRRISLIVLFAFDYTRNHDPIGR